MKQKLYIFTALAVATALYGAYSIYNMVLQCKTPFYIECVGKKLDTQTVIAISNSKTPGADTLNFNFEYSKALMPGVLAYLYYNKLTKQYLVQNNACVFNAAQTTPTNYFLPFCRALIDKGDQKEMYFGHDKPISEDILIKRGIKWNTASGGIDDRVHLQLIKYNGNTYVDFKDDGIRTKYLVNGKTTNIFDVFINKPVQSSNFFIYKFDNTSANTGKYSIKITASVFTADCIVKNEAGKIISESKGASFYVETGGFLFHVFPKYTISFFIFYLLFFTTVIAFQAYFLYTATRAVNPIIFTLFSVRILINCIVFLAIPLFLTSYYLGTNRSWYLFLVVLLNASYFTPKTFLHNLKFKIRNRLNINVKSKGVTYFLLAFIVAATLITKLLTKDENVTFLGIGIPILHVQKILLLAVFLITQKRFFREIKYGNWYRIAIVFLYSLSLSLLTSDLGSFLFTGLALLLVELVKKTIGLKAAIIVFATIGAIIATIYNISPGSICKQKLYRLVAPFTNPQSDKLIDAEEKDRETYSTLTLNLKNLFDTGTPQFNEVAIPGPMRTTIYTDYAVVGSYMLGGLTFVLLLILVLFYLIKELLLLLFFSIRKIRINQNITYSLPGSSEAELLRFFLAISIIQFCYPLFSNLLILPITGQSLPALSISNIEIIFLILLLFLISSIFSNTKYYANTASINYLYGDAVKSINWGLFILASIFVVGTLFKVVSLSFVEDTMRWTKHISAENIKLNAEFPSATDKQGLINYAKSIIGNDKLYSISSKKKPVLKELTGLYFVNKPYSQTIFESKEFRNSRSGLLRQITIDSTFAVKKKLISGTYQPFGRVYAIKQKVNNKTFNAVTNTYYSSITEDSETIDGDLTAETTKTLEQHLANIGIASNTGAVWIVDYNTGNVIVNSSCPIGTETNTAETYYFCGSLKKMLIAYASLKIDPSVKERKYYSTQLKRNISFAEFIQWSDDDYAANLLKYSMLTNRKKLNDILQSDFNLPLYSIVDDSYLDVLPTENDYEKKLNRNNTIYRQAIGQEKPYKFSYLMQWYCRFASAKKVNLKYALDEESVDNISMNIDNLDYLHNCFSTVLYGTAAKVRQPLLNNGIDIKSLFCKTGTAEGQYHKGNSSSSFIICNKKYCIGVELKGQIPENKENYSAKDLFIELIPILKKYKIL